MSMFRPVSAVVAAAVSLAVLAPCALAQTGAPNASQTGAPTGAQTGAQTAAPAAGVPLMKPALGATGAAAPAPVTTAPPAATARKPPAPGPVVNGFTTINWDLLVPADWDPFKDFKGANMSAMSDGDPRAQAMLKQMREAWDNAPTNPSLVGQKVRIPGFVVPLEDSKDGMTEFLLVPYFGACVHSPPPPANQVIHVLPQSPVKNIRSMDAVWINGVIKTEKTDSYMGAASYRIEAQSVQPYQEKAR